MLPSLQGKSIGTKLLQSLVEEAREAGASLKLSVLKANPARRLYERMGFVVTPQLKTFASPSGITGTKRTHRFRASGWTRHYETFSEILQVLVQLSLGLALANFQNHGTNFRFKMATALACLLAVGIGLTAMRTVLVALAIAAAVVVVRAARGPARTIVAAAALLILAFGATVVWQTRATNALWLGDPSSSLRARVAQVGLARI